MRSHPGDSIGRGAPALVLALAAAAAAGLAPAALADTVKLKSGQVIRGRVQDRGSYVIVERDISTSATRTAATRTAAPVTGTAAAVTATARTPPASASVRIERAEIESIEIDGQAARPPRDLDVVVFASGDELAGRVEIRGEGREVVIVGEQGQGEVVVDGRQVRTILWSKRAAEEQRKGEQGIGTAVQKVLADLVSGDAEAKKRAADKVHELGVYALPYLESRAGDEDPAIREAIRNVLEVARLKTYATRALAERVPGLARTLVEGSEAERLQALKEAVVASPRDTVPILVHLARRDTSKAVRAFALGQLTLMDRTQELVELLDEQDATLRFAAAIALGDNGVLVGVPLVIEGLKHEEVAVRKVSIAKLEAWTGQFLGFFAEDAPEKRAQAVRRWEEWWAKEGEELLARSLRATIRRGDVTEDEKTEGLAHWTNAQALWDSVALAGLEGEDRRREMQKVRFALEKSLERYPHNVTARIGLAVVLYVELGDRAAAAKELETVLRRYDQDSTDPSRREAHFHLGRIARLERRWLEGESHLKLALSLDGKNVDSLRELAQLEYDRAIADEALAREERRKLLDESVGHFGAALAAIDAYQLELGERAEQAADGIALARPFERGKFLESVDRVKLELRRAAADVRFLRGRSSAALGRIPDALADYGVAYELEPDNPLYRGALEAWAPRPEGANAPKK
jgi:tetratricopeptide (TPR) repeat protein